MVKSNLTLAEAVCLTLVTREPRHGWSIVKALAPDGEIGRVWSLTRPLTYRALSVLAATGMIEPRGSEPGAGPPRTVWRATPKGRRALSRAWLRRPVPHPRDMRSEFLLKLELGAPAAELARAQLAAFAPVLDGLERAGGRRARRCRGPLAARVGVRRTCRFLESLVSD